MLTGFQPGHDHRLLTIEGADNATTFPITLEFDQQMDCDSVTAAVRLNFKGGPSAQNPSIRTNPKPQCTIIPRANRKTIDSLVSAPPSVWTWTTQIDNASDGVYEFIVGDSKSYNSGGNGGTGTLSSGVRFLVECLLSFARR